MQSMQSLVPDVELPRMSPLQPINVINGGIPSLFHDFHSISSSSCFEFQLPGEPFSGKLSIKTRLAGKAITKA